LIKWVRSIIMNERPVVLITGAGSGIGAVIAGLFAECGYAVCAADIDGDRARAVAASLPEALGVTVDVRDRASAAAAVDRAAQQYQRLDVLVNNAAVCSDTSFEDLSLTEWHDDVAVSLDGAFLMSQRSLHHMVPNRRGCIVNIASVNAVGYFGNEAYSAAKAGLLSLTRSIAVRYGRYGIRSNAVVPGTIHTPIWDERLAKDPQVLEEAAKYYPLGRIGEPADVAKAVLFLASADASWITGISLPVDGGLLAGNMQMTADIIPAANEE
jgi:NAD(P)-dependent dehydrogenase (short-subunit alcohol dehydrogenase family)